MTQLFIISINHHNQGCWDMINWERDSNISTYQEYSWKNWTEHRNSVCNSSYHLKNWIGLIINLFQLNSLVSVDDSIGSNGTGESI